MAGTFDLSILQGKTLNQIVRLETTPYVYRPITAITQTAPAVVTAVAHLVPDGWRVAVVSAKGMTQINAVNFPPRDIDFHQATVLTSDTVELNDVNSADYRAYTSGGYLMYYTPMDLTGVTARMSIKDRVGGTELLRLDTTNGRVVVDAVANTVLLTVDAVTTAAITWSRGVYDLELVSGAVVTPVLSGVVTVTKEVTST